MQLNCVWTGREHPSFENCLVTASEIGVDIASTIVGYKECIIYKVDYEIRANSNWETVHAVIRGRLNNGIWRVCLESDGKGDWALNGRKTDRFAGCVDIDISLTPFTNSLPINRLKLGKGESRQIQVIYIDVLLQQVVPVWQQYTRTASTLYRYQNIPNDFEADVTVDELGLVLDYPHLFERKATLPTGYSRSEYFGCNPYF